MFLSFDIYKGEAQKKQPTKQTNKKKQTKNTKSRKSEVKLSRVSPLLFCFRFVNI
jgi:hypothetical protein